MHQLIPFFQQTAPAIEDWVFQGIIATLFAVFAWQLARLNKDEREKRDASWQSWMSDQTMALSKAQEAQTKMLADVIDRERDQRKEIMSQAYGSFSENMNRVARGLAELTEAVGMHDDRAEIRHSKIMEAITMINGKKKSVPGRGQGRGVSTDDP